MQLERKKRILFFGKFGYPPLGGGEYFILAALQHLKYVLGYDCLMTCYADPETNKNFTRQNIFNWDGIDVFQLNIRNCNDIRSVYENLKPDLVITHSFDAYAIIKVAKSMGIKTILGVHFWRNICSVPDKFVHMLDDTRNDITLLTHFHPVFYEADECYANSEFMQRGVEKFVGKRIERIIHPIINLERIEAQFHEPEFITMINPDFGKGGGLFVEIAKLLPFKSFMCVGNAPSIIPENVAINNELERLQNVKIVPKTNQMSHIYARSKMVLIPSLVDETFSMVALESMWNGIPVICTANGNLPNLVADSGIILNSEDPEVWKNIILELDTQNNFYLELSKRCIERSRKYSPEIELEKFSEMVKICIGNSQ